MPSDNKKKKGSKLPGIFGTFENAAEARKRKLNKKLGDKMEREAFGGKLPKDRGKKR